MADFSVVFDPMLDKERAEFENGSGGSGGSSYVGGERINIAGGTISFVNSADIVNVTGTSVTLQPDTAYKIYATSQAITLNANPPAAGKWAYEGHLEIFVAGTGYVVTGTNVVLANALEPDSVNNCTVRFHDGIAIISVEDHVAGYIVVNGSTAGDGSLYYGISTSTNDYVAFDASLNGTTIPLAGAVAEGEKHIVGNGYTETAITGAVDCGTSKFTVANLSLSNVSVNGGTMTLGDVFIPNSATVAVSGGGLVVEKVTGNGGVISMEGRDVAIYPTGSFISGVTLTGFYIANNTANGIINLNGWSASGTLVDCVITGNTAGRYGGVIIARGSLTMSNCIVSGNIQTSTYPASVMCNANGILNIIGGTYSDPIRLGSATNIGKTSLSGQTKIESIITDMYGQTAGILTITSGAIVDLTGNTNPTPVAPGGGVVVDGGCTVITSAGASVSIAGGTYTKINNDGTTE